LRGRGWFAALLLLALALAGAAAGAAGEEAPTLSGLRCALGPTPQTQELRVEVTGLRPVEQVIVFHRSGPTRRFSVHEMEWTEAGTWRAVLAKPAEPADVMECYLAASDAAGVIGRLGSPSEPVAVPIAREPDTPPEIVATVAGLIVAACLTLLLILVSILRRRRKIRVWSDQRYWLRMLGRLSALAGPALAGRLKEMSRRPLIHHRYGPVRWSRRELGRKVEEVRRLKRNATAAKGPSRASGAERG